MGYDMTDITAIPATRPIPRPLGVPTTTSDDVLHMLDAAVAWTAAVKRLKDVNSMGDADRRLREAIDAARAAGVGWGTIGQKLGIARGNAYQRYRKRPA
jgi:hypothetical protein